jgi:hypothetical protein
VSRIRVEATVDASVDRVWRRLADIGDHTSWMADAESITFTSASRSGPGTRFECVTRVGPFRTTDVMEITEWREGRTIGVTHAGVVTGEGRFLLEPTGAEAAGGARTRVTWDETLVFPWRVGGPLAGLVVAPVLRRVWRGNLRRLAGLVES